MLWKELAFRDDGTIRQLPQEAERYVTRLKLIEQRETPALDHPGAREIRETLQTYRDDITYLEGVGLHVTGKENPVKEELFRYLSSARKWGDFRRFERSMNGQEMAPLLDRIFVRDILNYTTALGSAFDNRRTVRSFNHFSNLFERTSKDFDPVTLLAVWQVTLAACAHGAASEERTFQMLGLIAEHKDATPFMLSQCAAELRRYTFPTSERVNRWLSRFGMLVAERYERIENMLPMNLPTDSRVELGYLAHAIKKVAARPHTGYSNHSVEELFSNAAKHAQEPAPPKSTEGWRADCLSIIRTNMLTCLERRPSNGFWIIAATYPLLKEPWGDDREALYSALTRNTGAKVKGVQKDLRVELLTAALKSEDTAAGLAAECAIRGEGHHRFQFAELIRLTLKVLAKSPSEPSCVMQRAIQLLPNLGNEGRVAIPEVLSLLGISVRSFGVFGHHTTPWKPYPHGDASVRRTAREVAHKWSATLNRGIHRKLDQYDRSGGAEPERVVIPAVSKTADPS